MNRMDIMCLSARGLNLEKNLESMSGNRWRPSSRAKSGFFAPRALGRSGNNRSRASSALSTERTAAAP